MPFAPLPTTFLNLLDCLAASQATVVELGSGGGAFSHLVQREGFHFFGLDKWNEPGDEAVQFIGNALYPPVLPQSVDLLLAANLVRHLLPSDPEGSFLLKWQQLLKPGGLIIIFEDHPKNEPIAVRNYRDVQLFLAELMGPARGPLLSRNEFQKISAKQLPSDCWKIRLENNSLLADDKAVLGFLAGTSGTVSPEVANLMGQIKKHGIAYGQYWWAQWGSGA